MDAKYTAVGYLPEGKTHSLLMEKGFNNPKFGPKLKNSVGMEILPIGIVGHVYSSRYNILATNYSAVKGQYSGPQFIWSNMASIQKQIILADSGADSGKIQINSGFSVLGFAHAKKKTDTKVVGAITSIQSLSILNDTSVSNVSIYRYQQGNNDQKGFLNRFIIRFNMPITPHVNCFYKGSYYHKPIKTLAKDAYEIVDMVSKEKSVQSMFGSLTETNDYSDG